VTSFELTVSGAEATELRTALASVASTSNADIAVEQVGLARRSKRLIVLDVDSDARPRRGRSTSSPPAPAGRRGRPASPPPR
jgi:phosphoserine phosphatase